MSRCEYKRDVYRLWCLHLLTLLVFCLFLDDMSGFMPLAYDNNLIRPEREYMTDVILLKLVVVSPGRCEDSLKKI